LPAPHVELRRQHLAPVFWTDHPLRQGDLLV
jgi:hypothetical protein